MTTEPANASRQITKSLLVVNPDECPRDPLPFIADALTCIATFLQQEPNRNRPDRANVGAGVILDFLCLAIGDVEEALEMKYGNTRESEGK